jgi:hypothetical protein
MKGFKGFLKGQKGYWLGKKRPSFSEEWRKNIGKSHKGLKKTEEAKIKIGLGNKGKFVSKETRKKMSENAKLRLGKRASNWKGGKSYFKESIYANHRYSEWRLNVFERDKWICKICGYDKGGTLQVHHLIPVKEIIKEYNLKNVYDIINCKNLWDVNNGITLCKKCHEKIFSKEKEYEELFKKLI